MAHATHFHIYNYNDSADQLTLTTLNDAEPYIAGLIAWASTPLVAGIEVSRHPGEFADEVIVVDHPETETYQFTKVPCAQVECKTALADYWL